MNKSTETASERYLKRGEKGRCKTCGTKFTDKYCSESLDHKGHCQSCGYVLDEMANSDYRTRPDRD